MDTQAIEEVSQTIPTDPLGGSPALARDFVRFNLAATAAWTTLIAGSIALESSEFHSSPLRYLRILAVIALVGWYVDARGKLRVRLAATFGQTGTRALLDWQPATKMEGWLVKRMLTLHATYGNDPAAGERSVDNLSTIEARRDRDRSAIMFQSFVPLFLAMLLIAFATKAGWLGAGETTTRGLVVLAITIPSLIAVPRIIRLCRCWGI